MQEFTGRIAVITGAASGIGHATAQLLAEQGAEIVGVDTNGSTPELMSQLPGERHRGIVRDLTDPSAAGDVFSEVCEESGVPHILVNSAGIGLLDAAVDVPAARWQATMDVNLNASFFMAQAAGRVMLRAGYGRIVNLASQAATVGLDQHAAYCASKAAVLGLTRVLALEWARGGVTVNAVSPTIVSTPLGEQVWSGEKGERARADIPVGRFARPREVASLIGYLCSDAAAMITGENVLIDGGYTATR